MRSVRARRANVPAHCVPGEVVWARVRNAIESPSSTGKARPVILVSTSGWGFRGIGLTTRSHYADGRARIPVPDVRAVGLSRPTWLWSGRLCEVSGIDIDEHIGWVDRDLVAVLIREARLHAEDAAGLLASRGVGDGPSHEGRW